MRSALLALGAAALLFGCAEDNTPAGEPADDLGVEPTADMGVDPDAAVDLDAGGIDPDASPAVDASVELDAELEPDVPFVEADLGPPMDEACNGLDDDQDGLIDEQVANLCGGCGGIPPGGCQSWQVSMLQDEDGRLSTTGVVGLRVGVSGFSERDIEGATCTVVRLPAVEPDAHLGIVNIDAPQQALNLVPEYVPPQRRIIYANSPELGGVHLHDPGDVVAIRAGGGRIVGPFQADITAPATLDGVDADELQAILDRARGDADGPVSLTWTPVDPAERGEVSLFVGGSRRIFRNVVYSGFESYQIDARLRDDGQLELPADFFGDGVPESSVRVEMVRRRQRIIPQGPHGLFIRIGQGRRVTAAGNLEGDDPPPFQITEPSPNVRQISPGEPLTVRWSELPEGEGPLTLRLTKRDAETGLDEVYTCAVTDAAAGALTLPGDFTEAWPQGEDDVRQLALFWRKRTVELAAPDRGLYAESVSVLLQLEPAEE